MGSGYFGGIYFGEYGNQVEADPDIIELEAASERLQTFAAARETYDDLEASTSTLIELEASR